MNFLHGIVGVARQVDLLIGSLFSSDFAIGFLLGIIASTLITGFVLTRDARHIPIILKYPSEESFEKVLTYTSGKTHKTYEEFLLVYTIIRSLFLLMIIAFFTVVGIILIRF